MNGVTIIAEHLCREISLSGLIIAGITITLLVVFVLAIFKAEYKSITNKCEKIIISVSTILIIVLYPFGLKGLIDDYNDTHMEYTVTVDDGVDFNDFHEKYEIISTDGIEYRVVEK